MSQERGGTQTATVLFSDLVGSTALRQALGDDAADEVRRRHDALLRDAVTERAGTVVKGTGDGVMAVFGSAADGAAAAVAMQQAFVGFNRRSSVPLAIRVGLSVGDVAWEDGDCFGTPVVEASRLCDAAAGGQILVSDVVRLLSGSRGGLRFQPVGTLTLKGLTEPLVAAEVAWAPLEPAGAPLPGGLAPADALPFVGRDEERARLERAWKDAQAGARQTVLLSGEPGVGKTRLAAEVARDAQADGAVVLFGRCDEDLAVPYQPFVEALAGYVDALPAEELLGLTAGISGELGRLLPRLADKVSDLPQPLWGDPETERYQQFEAVRCFVDAVAAITPVVLVLDDLHWAAKPTLLLLRHLLRGEGAVPVLVIGTYRDTDLGRGHPLAELLADLRRQPRVERVDLRGLPADGVAELIGAAAGQDLDAEIASLAEEVWGETEGNPFFVGQILRHLVETGAVVQEDGRWVRRAGELGLPEGVREVIGHRLSRLDDATNEVLALAAVLGREFDAETLVAASDGHAELVFDALEQAEQARLVTGTRGRPGRYSFVHALVRSTLYEELATTRRLRLHKRVGEVLEARHPERHADELAHHWCEAAVLDGQVRAVSYARQAAARALERLAYEEAVGWYERVLGVLDPDDGDHALRAELLIELGYALWFAGEHRWLAPMAEAMDEARAAGDGELFARAAIGRGGRRPWVEVGVVDDDLLAGLYEALDRLPPGDSPLRAMAMARIAGALYFRATSHDERIELSHASLAMASRCDDPEALAFVLICFHWGIWQPGNAAERLDVAQELLGLARRLGNRDMEAIALQYETGDRWELGDVAGARGGLQRLMAVNEQLGTPEGRWITSLAQGALSLFEGDVASVRRHMAEQTKWWGRVAPGNAQQLYGIQDLAVRHLCGGMEELLPLCEAMIETYPNVPAWRTAVVFIGWAIGDLERARRELDVLGADGFRLPLDGNWHVGVALCGLAAHAVGDVGAGERLYELLAPHSGAWVCVGMISDCLGPGHLYTGLAAGAAGRAEVAEHHLRVALELVEAAGSPRLALVVKTAWAQQAARVGDRRRAEELVAQVVRECHERGYDGLRAQAERVLAR